MSDLLPDLARWLIGQEFASIDSIPVLIGQHLLLSGLALAAAIGVAVPPAVVLAHRRAAPVLSVNVANAFRAVPAFGLLLLAFTVGGFSQPLLVGVFAVIGIAPIFANTYIGITQVPDEVVDAAEGMGLTGRQVIAQVELPLAVPVMMAGVRTAAVNIVATVTLAAIVGYGGLGLPIIAGLNRGPTRSDTALALLLGGAATVAVLSLIVEALLGVAQRVATPAGVRDQARVDKMSGT